MRSSRGLFHRAFEIGKLYRQLIDFVARNIFKQYGQPKPVLLRHSPKDFPALDRQTNNLNSAIYFRRRARDVTVLNEAIHDGSEATGGNHQAFWQFSQNQATRLALKLGQQLKSCQGKLKFLAELAANFSLDQCRTRQEIKP